MTAKLSAHDLMVIRGERCLFQGLEFALNAGELLLLEGQNGSGKTSLLRAIAGLLPPETGAVLWNDEPILHQRQTFHGNIAWLSHNTGLKADLTPVENLRFEMSLRPQANVDGEALFARLGIDKLKRLPLRSLSAGQQRRVALARLVMADVPLWLMDEPFTNLDQDGRQLVVDVTDEHLAAGGLCVMAAHQTVELKATVQRVSL